MLRVGLTGGIGSGKSTAAKIFRALGVPVYDSDSRAKQLMIREPLRGEITSIFGQGSFRPDGGLDTAFIASQAFTDRSLLDKLNGAVHPAVMEDFERWVETHRSNGERYVIQENAILFDHNFDRGMDSTVTISAPASERVARAAERDGKNPEDILHRIENQLSDSRREERADHVVHNGERDLLVPQIVKLHEIFSRL